MFNKISKVAVGVLFSLFISSAAWAADPQTVDFQIGNQNYMVDGATQNMDAAPYIESGRTFVPVRYLGNGLGATTGYQNGVVTVSKDGKTVTLTIGSGKLNNNGLISYMDVVPEVINGRTYLPARFVAEAFGYRVDFASNTVTVSKPVPMAQGPFDPAIQKLDMQIGSTVATATRFDGSTFSVPLDHAPVLVTRTENGASDVLTHFPVIYTNNPPIVDANQGSVTMCAPFASVMKAFGVPAQNVKMVSDNTLRFYQSANDYIDFTPGQALKGYGKLAYCSGMSPYLRMSDGVLMIDQDWAEGLIFTGIVQPIITKGVEDLTTSGADIPNGKVTTACYKPSN